MLTYKGFKVKAVHDGGLFIILKKRTKLENVPEEIKKEFPYYFRLASDDFYDHDENGNLVRDKNYISDYGLSKIDPNDAYEEEYGAPLYEYGEGMNGDGIIEYFVNGSWETCAIG